MSGLEEINHCIDITKYLDSNGELANISNHLRTQAKSDNINTPSFVSFYGKSSAHSLNDSFSSSSTLCSSNARIFHLQPKINVIAVTELSPDLGRLVMEEPRVFRRLLQLVLFQLAVSLGCEEVAHKSQLVVTPEVTGLAAFYEHRVRDTRQLPGLVTSDKLWSGKVQLVGLSDTVKYVSSASFVCRSAECEGCRDNMVYVKVSE